jgi:hypothetical protein
VQVTDRDNGGSSDDKQNSKRAAHSVIPFSLVS